MLVAADFSQASIEAFQVGCALAQEDGTRMVVLHVAEPGWRAEEPVYYGQIDVHFTKLPRDPAEVEATLERLRAAYAPKRHVNIEYQTTEGEPAPEICGAARKLGCDLIVMGTHGRTGMARVLTGSVAEAVLHGAPCGVLALRSPDVERAHRPIETILCPFDFSEPADYAYHVARMVARENSARLVVLHVAGEQLDLPRPIETELGIAFDTSEDYQSRHTALKKRLHDRFDTDAGPHVETMLVYGGAANEILRVAAQVRADLIVMGTHGRSGLSRLLLGSVAETVLRAATVPLLAVRMHHSAPETAGRVSEQIATA
jgi:nucleotide-binding universal stress UspA family protein